MFESRGAFEFLLNKYFLMGHDRLSVWSPYTQETPF